MALVTSRISAALWRKARSNVGIRVTRFTLVAVASVAASQIALSLLIGPGHQTAGFSGGLAAVIGAGVSYVLSRWAWERKGRPDLLRETLPFWLVPGLALVLPPVIWGWLTARVMGFDSLAEHASQAEREAILRAHRWPLLLMGIVCGFLCGVPSMIWTLGMGVIIAAPLVMVPVIWLYTLIFTFSALWFTHYGLSVLASLRDAESAMRAVQPVVAPASNLQLVEEVPPHERFGYEDSRPLPP